MKLTPAVQSCAPCPKFSKATCNANTDQDVEHWQLHHQKVNIEQLFGIDSKSATSKQELANLLQSKIHIKQLQNKIDTLWDMALTAMNDDKEDLSTTVNAIGDVCADNFKIDRGENKSPRIEVLVEPFTEKHVEEIVKLIDIGLDMNEDQQNRVCNLIREYTDVFALSLSEVLFIDWYKHKLNIPLEATFPIHIKQCPITEAQKSWFNTILDDMENSHV